MTNNEHIEKSNSAEETKAFAGAFAKRLKPGTVLAFYGPLGAGKTCFIQGLAAALGVTQAVTSPTYTLINEYKCDPPLYHIDLYRVHSEDEAFDLGLDEYLYGNGITAIEWSERVPDLLPQDTIHIHLEMTDDEEQRVIRIEGEL